MKIYLVGYLYDDDYDEGFNVINVVSTLEKAQCLVRFLKRGQFSDMGYWDSRAYEIREWEVDLIRPIGDIIRHKCQYGGEEFDMNTVLPYKVIKEEE